ncbi:glycosyltransferase family 4 protein [Neorhodopirellula pilleata]|uniref:D-inositol 3-phosphate glycosyltransferase n=1 Tax=Neorhodopirellula pilleata TaxID=2714738 RepID=A0A5C6AA99_9BACT|nr:glycosyltransferase family 4 protein [Neorhodopirellula pilleata]TWT96287.1 D-inositol 3-phosphate glycosyltransferase [Neorhodopirellula pilleata]
MKKRLAIVSTHPIQYNAPWFRMLAQHPQVDLHAFYTWHGGDKSMHDPGFGRIVKWDIPLTEGYEYTVCPPSKRIERRSFWNMDSPDLIPKLMAWNPDCVLVIGWNFRSHVRCMRRFSGKLPVWFRGDSTLLDKRSSLTSFIRSALLRRIYANVDKALAVGQNNRDYFITHGFSRDNISLVPHAIDNDRFSELAHDDDACELRHELGFSDDQVVVSFIGKIETKKAPLQLVQTFLQAAEQREELRLLMVGNGPLDSELSKLVGNASSIVCLPFQNQSQVPVVYRIGDVTCLPSLYNETWGLCLNESMASGRCVIASDRVGAARDLITPENGFQFQPGNFGQLSDLLVDLPSRHDLLLMGRQCQQFIQDWSFERIVDDISTLLKDI